MATKTLTTRLSVDEISSVLRVALPHAEKLAEAVGAERRHLSPAQVRAVVERKGYRYPKKNLVFHCLKGGASKTTLAYNCAYRLSQLGAKVLVVDLDKQGNATQSLAPSHGTPKSVFVDVVMGKADVEETIVSVAPSLDLLPSSLENARLEMELVARRKNPRTFYRSILEPIRARYDIVVFDLPPDLSHNTYLSSLAADTICIPINADEYSLAGMRMTLESLQGIREEYPDLEQEVLVVWSRYDGREKSSLRYIQDLSDLGQAKLLPVVIRTDIAFKNAQAQAKSVFQLGRRSSAREDIDVLAQELIGMRDYFAVRGNA